MEVNKPKRIVLKLSGESLKGDQEFGLDSEVLKTIATEIKKVSKINAQVSIVAGGGNFWRGAEFEKRGMDRSTADYAGMLATIMNALALQDELEKNQIEVRTQSALNLPSVAEAYIRRRAIRHLEKGRLVLFAGGTGNPFMSTDTAAALRASELDCSLIIKATKVDGIYNKDPNKHKNAKIFKKISYNDVINNNLRVMDLTAISLAKDTNIPIFITNIYKKDSLIGVLNKKGAYSKIS